MLERIWLAPWEMLGGPERLARLRIRFGRMLGTRAGRTLPIVLFQKRLFVLPTWFGMPFAALLAVGAFGALNYNNNLALGFSFLFASLSFLSVHIAHRNLLHVRLSQLNSESVHAGEEMIVRARFDTIDRRARTCLQAEFMSGLTKPFPKTDFELPIEAEVELRLPTARRGWLELPPILLTTEWPYGLFVIFSYLWPEQRALVYPKLESGAPPLPEAHAQREGHKVQKGEEDLRHLREYRIGDAPRRVAWKASAKREELLTRELESPQSADVILSFEQTQGLSLEQRLSRLAAWCVRAEAESRRFELHLPNLSLPRGSGVAHLHACLKALALH